MATIDQYKIKIDVEGAQAVDRLKNSLGGLKEVIAGFATAAFARGVLQMADAMSDLGKAVGLTAGEIAKFSLAVGQSGGNMENAGKMITTFYQHLEKAAEGGEDAQDALEKVGITLNDLRTLSERQLLQKAIDSLAQMEEGAKRTAAGVEIFGKSFRLIDPKQMQEILKSGDFDKLTDALDKVGQMNDDLARKFFYIQAAAAQAFATIGDYLEPLFNKTKNANDEFERAQNLIKAVGIALAVAVGVKAVTTIIDLVKAFQLFNTALKTNVGIQAALQALQGPKGWAILAGSVAAAGAAIVGLNKLIGDYTDKVDAAREAREALEGGKTDKPFDPNAQQFDKNKLKQREAAVQSIKEQNALLQKQNEEANKYQEIINGTIGMMDGLAARTKLIAEIDKETANKKDEIQKQINLELAKGKDVNMGVVDQLRQQQTIIEKQAAERKKLGLEEIASLETQRMNTAEMQKQLGLIDLQTQKSNAVNESQLRRKVIRGEITEQEMQDQLALDKIESARIDKVSKLEEQFKNEKNEARRKELRDEIDLTNQRAKVEKDTFNQTITDRQDKEQSYIAGSIQAMKELSKQFDPYKMGQDAIMMGWKRISDAVDTFVETGKFKFSDFARSVIADYAKMIAKAQIFAALNQIVGAIFPGLALPGKAAGGSVNSNQPYIVGEKGPELFVPKSAGDIIPNKDMTQPSMAMNSDKLPTNAPITNNYNTYNINALDAKSVAQLFAENRKAIFGANKMAEREMSYAGAR